jgi:sterol desaturase/sphingolipid hydroxylase (fatty acid hydroxylase superfamily)
MGVAFSGFMLIAGIVVGSGLLMMLVEAVRPGRSWPRVPGWIGRAILLNGIQGACAFLTGLGLDRWMGEHRPWSADGLGTLGGALVGYVAITFVYYWWHRWRHEVPFLWRWLHQVHHSPQRIEIVTSFYKHPLEIAANSVLSAAVVYFGVGLGPEAATLAILLTGLAELFYHWNVRTPYWLGFIVQRPESHCVHHETGIHAHNYSDLPIWDMIFGTFHNPRRFDARCGFSLDEESRLGEMLRGKEVTR